MRILLYLGFSVALLCLVVFADHKGKKHNYKDDHEKKGDDHEKKGDDHEKKGDDHEKKGDDHEKKGDDHEKTGDYHEKTGDDHEKTGDDPDHHRDNKQRSLADKILSVGKRKVGNKRFAFDLFSKVATDRPNENVVFSPVSIFTSVAFLTLSADGKTKDQIMKGFTTSETPKIKINHGFQNLQKMLDDNRELHLHSGNCLFVSQALKIKGNFLHKAKNLGSEVFTVNFEQNEEAKKQINDYVEKNTDAKIADVLSNVDKDAAFVFVNFVYFREQWEKPFDEKFTKEADFHVNKDLAVKVPFMSQTGFYKVAELDEATVVYVPYKGNASALFVLPKEGKMKEVESHQEDILTKYRRHCHKESIQLSIPKFSIDSTIDPEKLLHKLGIKTAFPDYSGITRNVNLKVGKVHHRVKLSVDEEGTEAAGTVVLKDIPTEVHHRVKISVDEEGTEAAGTAGLKDIPTKAQSKAKTNVDEKKTEAGEGDVLEAPPPIAFNRPFVIIMFNEKEKSVIFRGVVVNPKK